MMISADSDRLSALHPVRSASKAIPARWLPAFIFLCLIYYSLYLMFCKALGCRLQSENMIA